VVFRNDLIKEIMEVPITPAMYARADERGKALGCINQYSFMKGKSNIIGFLGEEIFAAAFPEAEFGTGIEYDFRYRGYTFEIKTKYTTRGPETRWEASVTDTLPVLNQKVEFYVFIRVFDNKSTENHTLQRYPKGWVCAIFPKELYFKQAFHRKQGELDPSNGNVAKYSCYNMFYTDMCAPGILKILPQKN
jgi:hypothetical protein